jgi:hypothetical protein
VVARTCGLFSGVSKDVAESGGFEPFTCFQPKSAVLTMDTNLGYHHIPSEDPVAGISQQEIPIAEAEAATEEECRDTHAPRHG